MTSLSATVATVHAGGSEQHGRDEHSSIIVELDGVVGNPHRSYSRKARSGERQAKGTLRRNERQWSAVSVEELAEIQESMDLAAPLTAVMLGANLCVQGIASFSRLPKGTLLRFPSGAELMVAEYNTPCLHMGTKIAASMETRSGALLQNTTFSKAAKVLRGVVGVVEVAGVINVGDDVEIIPYEHPPWLARPPA